MALTLYVDTERWRGHQKVVLESYPGLVPVVKGGGYGFGGPRLAAEVATLGLDLMAVGTEREIAEVENVFPGDLLVLEPVRPFFPRSDDPRVIHTVSRLVDLQTLADGLGIRGGARPRVVIELLTSIRRFGMTAEDLPMIRTILRGGGVRCEGFALHLPLPSAGSHRREVESWIGSLRAAEIPLTQLFVSHLSAEELASLSRDFPDIRFRCRVGTALWLGDRGSYHARAQVLDLHRVRRGDRYGYRQRRIPAEGHLVVVSGGTSHGIALAPPSHVANLRTRAKVLAQSSLEAAGLALSPFSIGGQRRWFAEPPHMQVSVLFLPASVPPPAIGEELDVNVGMTLTQFDQIVFE